MGLTTMDRNTPTRADIDWTDIQGPEAIFYEKNLAHEDVHIAQWTRNTNPDDDYLFGDLFLPETLLPYIEGIWGLTYGEVMDAALTARTAWMLSQIDEYNSREYEKERQAYEVSDDISPKYVYQGVCKGY